MRIAHFGTFDVANYGDLLFPAILERRLVDIAESIVHISPVGGPAIWTDSVPTIAVADLLDNADGIDAVIIGGGQLVNAVIEPVHAYQRGGFSHLIAYPSLWLGAAFVAAQHNIPLVWNGSGAPHAFTPGTAGCLRWAASVSDYLALRSPAAIDWFRQAGVTEVIHRIPDTAFELDTLWTEAELSCACQDIFAQHGRSVPERYVVFNIKQLPYGEDDVSIAGCLDRISGRWQACPVLLAIGPCGYDHNSQNRVARHMRTSPVKIDTPRSLLQVTACLARAAAYYGSSFHGMIAASVYGKPGILVVPDSVTPRKIKCTELVVRQHPALGLCSCWSEAEVRHEQLISLPETVCRKIAKEAKGQLETHWQRLCKTLLRARCGPSRDKRMALTALHEHNRRHGPHLGLYTAVLADTIDQLTAQVAELRMRTRHLSAELERMRRASQTQER